MDNKKYFSTWRQVLVILIFVGSFVIAGGYYYYRSEENTITSEKFEILKAFATLKINQLIQWQNERLGDANKLSQSVLFQNDGFNNYLNGENEEKLKADIIERLKTFKQNDYENIFISTIDGKLLVSSNKEFQSIDSITAVNISRTVKDKNIWITDIYRIGNNNEIFLDIIAPIMKQNDPIAIIVFRLNPNYYLYPLIQSLPLPGKTFESLIVRRDGDSVLYLSELRHLKNSALNIKVPMSNKEMPGVRAVSGYLGFNSGFDYRGVEVLYYINKVPGTSWFLETKVDKTEIFSELRYRATIISILMLLLILLSAMGLVWVYQYRQKNIFKDLFLAEKKLTESEDKFRFVFEKSLIGKSITLPDGKLLKVNKAFAEMLGYSIEEMQILKFSELTYPDDKAVSIEGLQSVLRGDKPSFVCEKRYIHKNGNIVFTEVSSTLHYDENNLPGYFITSIVDITKRKHAEEESRQAQEEILKLNSELEERVKERTAQFEETNKELEAFSYSVSHDLRAPLRAIEGFSRIVLEDYYDKLDDEGKRLLNVIRSNTNKMDMLVTDLLELSRTGRTEMRLARVDMTAMSKSIYHEVASPEVASTFNFSVSELPDACADSVLMRQVWVNLISNAIKYSLPKERRNLQIDGYMDENKNIYCIKDSGVGFNPAYAKKLFIIFQRLHKHEDFEGTGVGLAIVQRIIHRHGGEVWAEGEENKGAAFYFSLPNKKV